MNMRLRRLLKDGASPGRWRGRATSGAAAFVAWLALCRPGMAQAPKVYRDHVEAHWLAGDSRFWYRNDLRGGAREFVLVDADEGRRAPAFDHARAASALAKALGAPVSADRLPVDSLEFGPDKSAVLLRGPRGAWRLDLGSYALTTDPSAKGGPESLPFDRDVRPSRRTGPESEITFLNRLGADVELFWLDPEGNRPSYGLVKAGADRVMHTYGGHRFLVTGPGGGVIAVFEAADQPATAVVDGREPAPRAGEPPEAKGGREAASTPSPDGRREAFVRDHNLWIRDRAPGARPFPLSVDGNPGNSFHKDSSRDRLVGMDYEKAEAPPTLPEVFWSPDSTRLVALQTRTVPERRVHLVESSPKDQLQPKLISYPYLKAGDDIPVPAPRLFDAVARKEIPFDPALPPNPWEFSGFRWSADGSRFTFVDNQRGHQALRLISVDAATGATRSLVDERSETFIDYSGKFLCEWLGDEEVLWMSERDGWNHLWLYDARSGAVKARVTRGPWNVRELVHVDRKKRQAWFQAVGIRPEQDPYHIHLARVNLDGSGLVVLTEGDGTHRCEWSPDRRHFIDTFSRVDLPPITELRREDGSLACRLEEADAGEVLAARGRLPERFTAKGRDGDTDIWGVIHRPVNFDPSKRYPVIENIYAGPHDQHVPKQFHAAYRHQQEIADRGFVVVQIDGMGTSWRSKKFHDVAWRNLKDAGFPDRIAWMKAAAAKFPWLDLTRVGVYGGSAGGQNSTAALIWHGDFYKCAVSDCGCHDNRMDKIWWNEQWLGWPVGAQYEENSNTVNAARLQGALLLVVGELDKNVDPSSTLQLASALTRAGKDYDLMIVPGAGHGACETPWASRRRSDFFVRHLLTPQP